MERRGGSTGIANRRQTCPDTERTLRMTTELIRFTQWGRDEPQTRYTALMGLLAAEEGLADSYHRQCV